MNKLRACYAYDKRYYSRTSLLELYTVFTRSVKRFPRVALGQEPRAIGDSHHQSVYCDNRVYIRPSREKLIYSTERVLDRCATSTQCTSDISFATGGARGDRKLQRRGCQAVLLNEPTDARFKWLLALTKRFAYRESRARTLKTGLPNRFPPHSTRCAPPMRLSTTHEHGEAVHQKPGVCTLKHDQAKPPRRLTVPASGTSDLLASR